MSKELIEAFYMLAFPFQHLQGYLLHLEFPLNNLRQSFKKPDTVSSFSITSCTTVLIDFCC